MFQYTPQELISLTVKDCFRYRTYIVTAFAIISLSILVVGVNWPKHYKAESLIYVDNRNVIKPLMQGTAVTAESKDIARNAQEIILGSKILDYVLTDAGWLDKNPNAIDREYIVNSIKERTLIKKVGDSLIRVEFTDKDPRRAYLTTKNMAEKFVDIGKTNKVEESRSAYDFIEKQAADYLQKLTDVDKRIKDFVSNNPDARPGSQEKVTQRVSGLQRKYEDTTLSLREASIKKDSIEKQLSGEAAMTISQSREGQYRKRITDMEEQLETLLLTYTETYPDVIRLRRQIEDTKQNLSDEVHSRDEAIKDAKKEGKTYFDSSIATNPIYQQLRSNLSNTETEIATLQTRLKEINTLLGAEYDRIRRIEEGDAMMQELTRDYQVNQEIYQDLLKRRENARISRSLEAQEKGSTFSIQEPAKLPVTPYGLRFLHFALLGIVFGTLIPVAVVFGIMQVDGRLRSGRQITDVLDVPVLAEVPQYWKADEMVSLKRNYLYLILTVTIILVIFVVVSGLKYMGIM